MVTVESDAEVMGGMLVICGTRFPVYRLFVELSDGFSLSEIAEDFNLDITVLQSVLEEFAFQLRCNK